MGIAQSTADAHNNPHHIFRTKTERPRRLYTTSSLSCVRRCRATKFIMIKIVKVLSSDRFLQCSKVEASPQANTTLSTYCATYQRNVPSRYVTIIWSPPCYVCKYRIFLPEILDHRYRRSSENRAVSDLGQTQGGFDGGTTVIIILYRRIDNTVQSYIMWCGSQRRIPMWV